MPCAGPQKTRIEAPRPEKNGGKEHPAQQTAADAQGRNGCTGKQDAEASLAG